MTLGEQNLRRWATAELTRAEREGLSGGLPTEYLVRNVPVREMAAETLQLLVKLWIATSGSVQ